MLEPERRKCDGHENNATGSLSTCTVDRPSIIGDDDGVQRDPNQRDRERDGRWEAKGCGEAIVSSELTKQDHGGSAEKEQRSKICG